MPDLKLANDPSVPVVVTTVRTFYGQGPYVGRVKVMEAKIQSRGPKATQSVLLRWQIVNLDEPDKVLLEGFTPEFEARVEAHGALQMDNISTIYFNKIVRPLLRDGELSGPLQLVVAVHEVRFADETVWNNNPQAAFVRASFARKLDTSSSQKFAPAMFLKLPLTFDAKSPAGGLSRCTDPVALWVAGKPLSFFQSDPACKSNYSCDYDPVANKNICRVNSGLWCDLDGCDSEGHCSCTTGLGICPGCGPCTTDPDYSEISAERCGGGFHWACLSCNCVRNSPVLIDVLGDGFALTDALGGVNFNFDGDGPIPTSWTAAGSDDAFLVLDRNGNGAVDAGWELFGNEFRYRAKVNGQGRSEAGKWAYDVFFLSK